LRVCENCYRRHWRAKISRSTGLQVKHVNGNLVYVCIFCGNVQEEDTPVIPIPERIQANILYIDIETSKSLYYNYGRRVPGRYLRIDDLVHEWYMIGWSASYVGNDRIWSQIVTPEKAIEWDDSEIVRQLHDIMEAAEIIAGHNVQGFDYKRCNTRFTKHGLSPITDKKFIDTLKLARTKYAFESNTLDYIANWFGLDGKEKVTNEDWLAVLRGDKKTLEKIAKYNRKDVSEGKLVLERMIPIANKRFNYGALKLSPPSLAELKPPKKNELR